MIAQAESNAISRREFLYYIWGAGAGLLGMGVCGASVWYAMPHPEYGRDLFLIDLAQVELPVLKPLRVPEGKFWLSNTDKGVMALSMVCPHYRYPRLYKWVPTNVRFECPGCGSKFQLDGSYIEGPSARSLDRYPIQVTTPNGTVYSKDGSPINIEGGTKIVVDIRETIRGKLNVCAVEDNIWDCVAG